MKSGFRKAALYGSVAAASLLTAGQALAQAQDEGATLETVVVTARRVEENVQQTPVAVSALSAATLKAGQVDNVADLQRLAPNLAVTTKSQGGSAFGLVSIRGQTNTQQTLANDTAIGVYLDGVYIGHSAAQLSNIFDVERVEVLRGPQGTLFGRNTTGGAINVTTVQPSGEFGGYVVGGAGNFGQWKIGGAVNVPLWGEQLAIRLAAQHVEHDGYQKNRFTGEREADDNGNIARLTVRLAPDDAPFDITARASYTSRHDHGAGPVLLGFNPGSTITQFVTGTGPFAALGPQPPLGRSLSEFVNTKSAFWDTYSDAPQSDRLETKSFNVTANFDVGFATLKSISAYEWFRMRSLTDLDATPFNVFPSAPWERDRQFSQEFQLIGDVGERLKYIGGFYYSKEKGFDQALSASLTPVVSRNIGYANNQSTAVYGQVNFKLTDRLTFTGGLRYTWDERGERITNYRDNRFAPNGFASPGVVNCQNGFPNNGTTALGQNDDPNNPLILCQLTLTAKFDYLSYLASVDFQVTDDVLLYAKTSRAFLAGGWNFRAGAPALSFRPEQVEDAEVGLKADWLNGRLRTNIAGYYAWQTDVQRRVGIITPGTFSLATATVNAAKAHVYGVEFEVTAIPWTGMRIDAALGLTKPTYDEYFDIVDADPAAPGVQELRVDRTGENFLAIPEKTYSIGATQTLPSSYGKWTLHLDYAYIGAQSFYEVTPSPLLPPAVRAAFLQGRAFGRIKGYGVLNGRIALDLDGPDVQLAVWGRNLANNKYISRTFADIYGPLGYAMGYPGDPRTFGVEVTYRFR